ncbi:hypothetical protein [Mesorhizobium sp. LNJC391B00]|uniref:hypothetical protein n=1 Tax=Mesorhizobium sp. LNJC391B00 TaxID=1287273 RepID=UPI0018DD9D82|nr:hypothetical protein [Mesorhizobium sp. LNJC391B00]
MVEYVGDGAAGDSSDPADIGERRRFGSVHFPQLDNFLERSKFFLDGKPQLLEIELGALQRLKIAEFRHLCRASAKRA